MAAPVVSVVLPSYNSGPALIDAVRSVLDQSIVDVECLVVDDGSTDQSIGELNQAVADSRLRVLSMKRNLGIAHALNRGIDEARGRFVARMDADDLSLPNRFETQIQALRAADAAICGSAVYRLSGDGIGASPWRKLPEGRVSVRAVGLFNPCFHPTLMFDRRRLQTIRYDPSYVPSEDWKLLYDAVHSGHTVINIDEPLLAYRVYDEVRKDETYSDFPEHLLRRIEVSLAITMGVDPSVALIDADRESAALRFAEFRTTGSVLLRIPRMLVLLRWSIFRHYFARSLRAKMHAMRQRMLKQPILQAKCQA
jgi:glycosyltransferase involved in cell wall biosynthesis